MLTPHTQEYQNPLKVCGRTEVTEVTNYIGGDSQSFLEQCRKDLRRLRVAWIEVKVGPGRLVTYNPTGYQFKVEFHVDAKPPLPYPVLNRIQRKRMYAQSLGTTFVYDFVDMFHFHAEIYLKGLDHDTSGFRHPSGPCFHAAEMVLNSEVGLCCGAWVVRCGKVHSEETT